MIQTLNLLWQKKAKSLGEKLQKGLPDLVEELKPVAEENNYSQKVQDNEIHWYNKDGKVDTIFFYISDPRNLELISDAFQKTKDSACDFSSVFVHQWTDGQGNWDVFGLHPQRGLVHWNRFWGQRSLENDTGPFLREDTFIQWVNTKRKIEVMFFIYQGFPGLDDYIQIYKHIANNVCPVTFLIQKGGPKIFDIFRLSARSYLEHHNQLK